MILVRRIGATILIVAALAVWFGMAPDSDAAPNNSSAVASIEAEDDANNALAEGAPQQTVVNGWTTINYLNLLSEQVDEAAAPETGDQRTTAMLGLCVLGIALIAFTGLSTAPISAERKATVPADT